MLLFGALLLARIPAKTYPLALDSLVPPNALRVEQVGATRPLYAGLRLFVGEPGTKVEKPADLEGKVRIVSAEQALEYVRLLRSPGVWPFFFKNPILEVQRGPLLFRVPELLYNDLRPMTISGWDGVVNEVDWKRLDLREPKVGGGNGKDWNVRRPCLVPDGDGFKVGTLVERVSEKGRYVSSIERPTESPRGIRWHITVPANR